MRQQHAVIFILFILFITVGCGGDNNNANGDPNKNNGDDGKNNEVLLKGQQERRKITDDKLRKAYDKGYTTGYNFGKRMGLDYRSKTVPANRKIIKDTYLNQLAGFRETYKSLLKDYKTENNATVMGEKGVYFGAMDGWEEHSGK